MADNSVRFEQGSGTMNGPIITKALSEVVSEGSLGMEAFTRDKQEAAFTLCRRDKLYNRDL